MTIHQFNYPTVMLYGPGAVAEFAARLAGNKPAGPLLLVTDPGLVRSGLAESVADTLSRAGLSVAIYTDVHPNPIEADVVGGAARFRESGAAGLVAVGGGSPMDVAKAIAVLATHEGPLSRFDDGKGGDRFIDQPLPPVYAIPTTAGTGSEVGRSGVIICADTRVKTVIFHPDLLPRIAVLDPELTVRLPANITAQTGMDAFTHCLEAYLARGFHPMADAIALGGMEIVAEYLPRAIEQPDDLDARGQMLVAASMGATAFQKGLGVIHSMAHPLSTRYGIHHGLANALLMPPVLRWQLDEKRDQFTDDLLRRYQRIAQLIGRSSADELPRAIADLCAEVRISVTLPKLGMQVEDIPSLAEEAHADICHHSNPIAISRDDLERAYAHCM
ncbi:MAG: iron-containing alcohol dehydrogenase [Proteobacteria bacterium]|nr:iron-containing alcohol dehydrogenase [Pseudomonadota bacterium]